MFRQIVVFASIGIILLAASIATPQDKKDKKKKEVPQPTIVKLSTPVPSLTGLSGTEQSQTKGGLRITTQTETYKAIDSMMPMQREVPPPQFLGVVAMPSPDAKYVELTYQPALAVSPERLNFHVHISNGMSRVFRGSGIAVQFNVAGKIVTVDPSGYGDLVNVIIPPRGEQEVVIVGPEISSITAPCTIGLFLYDVVTNTDQAGNVTEKQNFEWYFSYQTQAVEKEFSVPAPTRQWMVPRH
jgi:hypothetical protein